MSQVQSTTIFEMNSVAFDYAKANGFTAARIPWGSGSSSFMTSIANMCKAKAIRPLIVYDGMDAWAEQTVHATVAARSLQLKQIVPRFDVQCGVEIQPTYHTAAQQSAMFALARKVEGWSLGVNKYAPPVLCMNSTLGYFQDTIRLLYGTATTMKPTIDFYMDWSGGDSDEIHVLDEAQRAFQDCGISWDKVSVMEWGMSESRAGTQGWVVAYNRMKAAVERSRYPYVGQFAMMDGVNDDTSFGLLKSDYTLSKLGQSILTA